MRPMVWKLAITIVAGAAIGTIGGQATIAGMAPPVVTDTGTVREPDLIEPYLPPASADPVDYARIADACTDCSDYELGYRFAAARQLRTTTDCMDYSWSYQRGCLAYLREG